MIGIMADTKQDACTSPTIAIMSETYVQLILGLTPPGRGYRLTDSAASRDRFVMFVLAYMADDSGRCQVSITDLVAYTHMNPGVIRAALYAARDRDQLAIIEQGGAPNVYQLNEATLRATQFDRVIQQRVPMFILTEYGLSDTFAGRLSYKFNTMAELGDAITRYRESPADVQDQGFHVFLDTRLIGAKAGRDILDAYDRWAAEG